MANEEVLIDDIRDELTSESLYEQMAEESIELAHACLKKARKMRGENYTPRRMFSIDDDISEEFTDVMVCANTLALKIDPVLYSEKLARWHKRNCNPDGSTFNEDY